MRDQISFRYSTMARRVQAGTVDFLILLGVLIGLLVGVSSIPFGSVLTKTLVILTPVVLYEPILTSWFGGTAGYYFLNQRICDADTGQNLSLWKALVRYLIKLPFGVVSLLFMLSSPRHQSLHDRAANSVVIIRNAESEVAGEALPERTQLASGFQIFLYVIAWIVLVSLLDMLKK